MKKPTLASVGYKEVSPFKLQMNFIMTDDSVKIKFPSEMTGIQGSTDRKVGPREPRDGPDADQ